MESFKADCHNFFIEVVCTLCFGGEAAPEPDLIEHLMSLVFTKDRNLVSPLSAGKHGEISAVKSSLFQLLLEHKYAAVFMFAFM